MGKKMILRSRASKQAVLFCWNSRKTDSLRLWKAFALVLDWNKATGC